MAIFMKQRLGIDLGTTTTLIYIHNKGIALREPTLVAVNKSNGQPVAFGKEAEAMRGRTSEEIELVQPLREGVIANFTLAKQMLSHFIKEAVHRKSVNPEVVICVPSFISKVERKALVDTVKEIGIRKALIVEEPFAAAIGLDLPIEAPKGRMVVDVGGGTTDIAMLSYGEIVHANATVFAGNAMDQAIQDWLFHQHQCVISPEVAEKIKIKIGQAAFLETDVNDAMLVKGRSVVTGLPTELNVTTTQIHQALDPVIKQIVQAIKAVFQVAAPELVVDVLEAGIYLCGGGALLQGLADRLSRDLKVPVHLQQHPIDVVVIGAGKLLDRMNRQAKKLEKERR
ncbi:TPA: rod shape-determining protein [Streptococcus suis]